MVGAISPLLARSQGINGKLQTFVGIFLRLSFSGLVVGDDDTAAGYLVDAINAAHYFYLAHLYIKEFFGVQHFRCGSTAESSQEILQLQDTLLVVKVVLVAVLNAGGGEFV